MTIEIDDELIRREIVRALTEHDGYRNQAALAAAGRKTIEAARPELEAMLASIVSDLLADAGFRARIRASMEAAIEDVARAKVTAAAKRLPVGPLLEGLTK